MATKSLLLSCLLMGMGIAQHPVLEANQTQDAPTFTVPAGFKTSTDPPLPPSEWDEWDCVPFTPEIAAKINEFESRVNDIPSEFLFPCLEIPSPKEPECEPVHEYRAWLREKCPGYPANLFSNNLGIGQHPVSEGTQMQDIPTSTSPATFATSTPPSSPPAERKCELSSKDILEFWELQSRVQQMPEQDVAKSSTLDSSHLPDYPECEPIQEVLSFLKQKCPRPQVGVRADVFEDVDEDNPAFIHLPPRDWGCGFPDDPAKYEEILSNWWEMPIQDAANCSPSLPDLHVPDYAECEPVQEFMDLLKELCSEPASDVLSNIPKDVSHDNDMSCLSWSAVDWSESHRRHNEADICVPRPAQGVSLGKQDSDEPYDPDLKPVYDFCDVLEDPEEHTMCVLAELARALCEQDPWIAFCQDLESGGADWFSSKSATIYNELLDEIFDTDDVVPVADEDELPRHPQVSAASEATEIARLIEKIPLSSLEKFSQECEHAVGYLSLGHCVSEKMRDEVCSSNPGSKICEVPRAALINERDLPLYTKTIDSPFYTKTIHFPLYTETININN